MITITFTKTVGILFAKFPAASMVGSPISAITLPMYFWRFSVIFYTLSSIESGSIDNTPENRSPICCNSI